MPDLTEDKNYVSLCLKDFKMICGHHSKLPLALITPSTEATQKCKVWTQSPILLKVFMNGPHADEAALADPFAADRWTARTSTDTVMFYFCPTLNKLRVKAGLSFKGRTTRSEPGMLIKQNWQLCPRLTAEIPLR